MKNSPSMLTLQQEKSVLYSLFFVQFLHILDFVIMMPLGPFLMEDLNITSQQFGVLVSIYTLSSGVIGLLGSLFFDRFNKKYSFLTLFILFSIPTLLCGLTNSYTLLILARALAGAFGGVLAGQVHGLVGDLIPPERRGTATGIVMSAFPFSSTIGVPIGLFLSSKFSWSSPFIFIFILSLPIIFILYRYLPNLPADQENRTQGPALKFKRLLGFFFEKNTQTSLIVILLISAGPFMVIPYIAPYLVSNLHISKESLPLVYAVAGAFTFFSSRLIGKFSDSYGAFPMFKLVTILGFFPLIVFTHLSPVPLMALLVIMTLFMALLSGRVIPAMTMIIGSTTPTNRQSFLTVSAAVQHFGGAIGPLIGGLIITETTEGLLNYGICGILACLGNLLTLRLAKKIKQISQ